MEDPHRTGLQDHSHLSTCVTLSFVVPYVFLISPYENRALFSQVVPNTVLKRTGANSSSLRLRFSYGNRQSAYFFAVVLALMQLGAGGCGGATCISRARDMFVQMVDIRFFT